MEKWRRSRKQNRINVKYIEVYMLSLVVFLGYKQIGLALCGCVGVWVCRSFVLHTHKHTHTHRPNKQTDKQSFIQSLNQSVCLSIPPTIGRTYSCTVHFNIDS